MSNGLWRTGVWRTRWAAIGAAVAVTLGAGGLFTASAAIGSGERTVFVPITPCRIMDTRPGEPNTGPRATPIAAEETHTIDVRGTNGKCTIPADAVGVSLNVTALNGTSASFLTVFPADAAARPGASSLNWQAGQAPTPNGVVADLAADGRLSFFNFAGTVDVIADVVGYYADHNHDDRYYTEQEVDAALTGKANTTDLAAKANTADVNAALATKVNSISGTPGTLVIGPSAFAHDGTIDTAQLPLINTAQGQLEAEGPACFVAPVQLPVGATITSFALSALDNDTLPITATLRRDPVGPGAPTQMAQLVTVNSASAQSQSTNTIADAVVATTASYGVDVCLDINLFAYSVTIGYTNP
jgi:hypothetical protein